MPSYYTGLLFNTIVNNWHILAGALEMRADDAGFSLQHTGGEKPTSHTHHSASYWPKWTLSFPINLQISIQPTLNTDWSCTLTSTVSHLCWLTISSDKWFAIKIIWFGASESTAWKALSRVQHSAREINQRNSLLKTEGQVPSWQLLLELYTRINLSSLTKIKSKICHNKTFLQKVIACLYNAWKRFLFGHVHSTCINNDFLPLPISTQVAMWSFHRGYLFLMADN